MPMVQLYQMVFLVGYLVINSYPSFFADFQQDLPCNKNIKIRIMRTLVSPNL